MSAQWSELHRRAKALEARLETKIQRYASLAQKINADFLCDEENPLLENREEQELGNDIERDLSELSECIDAMRHCNQSSSHTLAHNQDILIKRYQEIHFDYSSEFKTTSAAVTRKRESMELFQSSKKMHAEEHDSSVAKLLRERSSIAASLKSVNDLISEAFDTRGNLSSQRDSLTGASGSLSGLSADPVLSKNANFQQPNRWDPTKEISGIIDHWDYYFSSFMLQFMVDVPAVKIFRH